MDGDSQLLPDPAPGAASATSPVSIQEIYARLDNVYDPELDESILQLGFVDDVHLEGRTVTVTYKLPTFWCAPNFAYMMSADVREQVGQVPGVEAVQVILRDHCAEEAINQGVNQGRSFRETFPDEAVDDLDELRRKFLEKSFLARQEQLIRQLRRAGLTDAQIVALRVADLVPAGADLVVQGADGAVHTRVRSAARDLAKYRRKQTALGLGLDPEAPLFTALDGTRLSAEGLPAYLRHTRTVRVSLAFNTTLCEGLLRARYHPEQLSQTAGLGDVLLSTPRGT